VTGMHAYVRHDGRARLCAQGRACLPDLLVNNFVNHYAVSG